VDIFLLQVVLWFGMLFLLWVMKDSLGKVESSIDSNGHLPPPPFEPVPVIQFSRPDKVREPIGTYQDAQIFRFARIEGKNYEFEHIWVDGQSPVLEKGQRCVAPGLVYNEC
jgi:hypothetical protein